jgi:hypothetical protein
MTLNPLEFLVTFLPGEDRKLTRTGVEIHRLQYWSDTLAQWVGQHRKVRVHYDPRDISVVYVRSPIGIIVKAPITIPSIFAISLAEWNARRQRERSLCRQPHLIEMADNSQKRGDQLVKDAKEQRRVRRRKATEAAGDRWRPEVDQMPVPDTPDQTIQHNAAISGTPTIYHIQEFDYGY